MKIIKRPKLTSKNVFGLTAVALTLFCSSCSKYLDIVPDNTPQLDDAFASKATTYNYLATCYHFLPNDADMGQNPAFLAGDEIWGASQTSMNELNSDAWLIALGSQQSNNVRVNSWEGGCSGINAFVAIADCNTFLSYVTDMSKIPDLDLATRTRWTGEVEFLKAYYNFVLFRQYGPIPICDKNIPMNAPKEEMWVKRQPVDSCVNYMVNLLDDAITKVPQLISSPTTEDGRITKVIAMSVKARLLLLAASPLFNGNSDYSSLANKDGEKLFNPTYDASKWQRAADAAKAAIDEADADGFSLYHFVNTTTLSMTPRTLVEMNARMVVCDNYNSEIIWGLPHANGGGLQFLCQGILTEADGTSNTTQWINTENKLNPPLRMAKLFYTKNGVPINEDKTLDFTSINTPMVAADSDKVDFKPGYASARLNFDREPRFYADMCFDGGTWLMYDQPSRSDLSSRFMECKANQQGGYEVAALGRGTVTGYFIKKLVHPGSTFSQNSNSRVGYAWPEIRLADLYLIYAEALNESNDSQANRTEAYTYLDPIRARAGLSGVVDSWAKYSTNPTKPLTQSGLRAIIKQERGIELAFEGSRFWDLRRWKDAVKTLNAPIQGWSVSQPDTKSYNQPATLFQEKFIAPRDYLWPVGDPQLLADPNLVQNTGW